MIRLYRDDYTSKKDKNGKYHNIDDYVIRLIPEKLHLDSELCKTYTNEIIMNEFFSSKVGGFINDLDQDSFFKYFLYGIEIPYKIAKIVIHNPSKMTIQFIQDIKDNDVRQAVMNRYNEYNNIEVSNEKTKSNT